MLGSHKPYGKETLRDWTKGKKIQILKERLSELKIFSTYGRDGVTILNIV